MTIAKFGEQPEVEAGTIIMWAGVLSNIPAGWVLCDGLNGTPDYTGRFVKSVANASDVTGGTGGTDSYSLSTSQLPSHSHGGSTSTDGSHTQSIPTTSIDGTNNYEDKLWDGGSNESVGNAGAHSHTITVNSIGSGSTIENRPKYYELAYIQKT